MPLKPSTVKTPVGMQTLDFWPIVEEPANAHPTYGERLNRLTAYRMLGNEKTP